MRFPPPSSMTRAAAFAAAAAVLLAGSARADLVVSMERKSMRTDAPVTETQQMSLSGDKLTATAEERGRPTQIIWRGDKQALYSLDPAAKTYYEIDKATMAAVNEQVNGAMKSMQEQMAKMTPEQRAQVEKMMGGMPNMGGQAAAAPAVEVKATGDKQTVQGYPCTRYDVLLGGKKSSEMWVASWGAVKIDKSDIQALTSMNSFFEEMLKGNPMLGKLSTSSSFQGLDRVDGFPVLIRHFDGDKVIEEMTLKGVERRAVPAGSFDVPAGYTRKELGPKP
jgi:hypothetical protein